MKIMLTGAAGNVGLLTLVNLLADHHDVTVLELDTPSVRKRLHPYTDQCRIIYGSVTDQRTVAQALQNQDAVIHLAAIIPPQADRQPQLAQLVNYQGTKVIVEAIQHQDQPPLLLFSSSISVYGDRIQDYWIRVGDPLKPSRGDYYAELKIQCEQLIQAASIPYVIFRLTGIMGYPAADPLMFHMPLDTHLEFASNCDTGFALAKAVQHRQELEGRIFNLGGGEGFRITYRSFIKNMLSIYGLNPCYLRQECFATKNFHCGYYADSDELNDILHFQRDNLDSYYARTLLATARPVYLINRLFGWLILRYLQHHSDPYQALRHHDQDLIDRFY